MSVFKFKEFSIIQEDSAMKVGTDGVLLGAWASCENQNTILDVGCGTGLITLMLAQRNNNSSITGIDIDKAASNEAQLNTNNSDWEERITIKNSSLQDFYYKEKFDLIVSNPPYVLKNEVPLGSVVLSEPFNAIFVDEDDPFIFYKAICQFAKQNLNPGGKIFFEINSRFVFQLIDAIKLLGFYRIEIRHDFFEKKFRKIIKSKNKNNILDPFNYYS